jgi:alkyl hydroperoxide reductase subunit F
LLENGNDARKPSFSLNRPGGDISLRFAGIPMGHEFTSLVLALLQVGGHPSKASAEVIEQIRSLKGEFNFETYFSLSCQNCPDVVQALNLMAVLNPNIRHVAIDGALFQDEVDERHHGGAEHLPQRRELRPGPHGPGRNPRQARHQRHRASGREDQRQRSL